MKSPIGQLKVKQVVYCEICGKKHTRILTSNIYENTDAEKNNAKKSIQAKYLKEYTCMICKSMLK